MAYDNYENLGFQVKVDGADSAVSNLDRVIQRLEKINQLQGKKVSTSKQVINAQKQEEKQTKRNTQSLTSYLGKLTSTVVIARKFAHLVTDAVNESAKYVENLNLFAVAFGDTYQQTLDWALNIADAYGLASNEVVRFAGVFRELSTSLGLVDKTADTVTKALTNYGYDLSALFNVSVEQAMEKLQSGIFSGNVRPLRAFGIDISQNQIDNLFKTNEALASMGVNARNLSQSDKVIARLVIALQSGTDAFGTMYREINNLQSQFRIFQGSLQNFKLAVGDLVQQPIADAMVYINAFIIAMTDIIRAFVPLKTIDETPVGNLGAEADEASQALDNLNGKLADFDKFNVLGGQSSNGSQLAVTEALNKLLEEQVALYDDRLTLAMESATNQATALATKMKEFFIITDENGKFLEWTNNAKALAVALTALSAVPIFDTLKNSYFLAFASKETGDSIAKIALSVGNLSKTTTMLGSAIKFLTSPVGIILAVVGVLYATNEEFRESINGLIASLAPLLSLAVDLIGQVLKPIIPLLSGLANILGVVLSFVVKVATGIIYVAEVIVGVLLSPIELIIKGISTILILLETLFNWNWLALGEKLSKLWGNWAIGDIVVGASQGLATTVRGYADGGYTNANLIMTHENGKREWVGKAAGSSAIVNDTQMSDIMEVAVAKGVYNALSARSAMGGNVPANETIVIKIGEEAVFNAVRKTARRQGRDFATV